VPRECTAVAAGMQIIGPAGKFRDGSMSPSVPTLAPRHVGLPFGKWVPALSTG
jgi:hypothetical protein